MSFYHSQQDFNYSNSNCYYGGDQQWQSSAHYSYGDMDSMPRTTFVSPQALQVTAPSSPPTMEEYAFSQQPSYYPILRPATEDDDFMDYDDIFSGQRRQQPTTAEAWTQNQFPKYAIDRTNSRSNGYGHHSHSLPTPPSSPTSMIPLSAISSSSSSASSSAAMSRTMTTTNNNKSSTGTHHANTSRSRSFTSQPHQYHQHQQSQQQQPRHSSSTSSSSSSIRHFCTHPSCLDADGRPIRSFSRRADLQRHHTCEHDAPVRFSCPRPNCIRKGTNGFTRQDHLVEHRRGYHGESIPKRGQRGSASPDSTGSAGRAEGRRRK